MSQTAVILSCAISLGGAPNGWSLMIGYFSDAGQPLQAQLLVGSGPAPTYAGAPPLYAMWGSANATISATLPGTATPVLIPCPPLVQWAAFGVFAKGLPTQ